MSTCLKRIGGMPSTQLTVGNWMGSLTKSMAICNACFGVECYRMRLTLDDAVKLFYTQNLNSAKVPMNERKIESTSNSVAWTKS